MQLVYALPVILSWLNCDRKPLIWCGTDPSTDVFATLLLSNSDGAPMLMRAHGSRRVRGNPVSHGPSPLLRPESAYPFGCWRVEVISSTAVALAMAASPGLVTVHIWSRVLSLRD